MARLNGSGSQVVPTVGMSIPQKCLMQQKHNTRPGPVKVWTKAEIRRLESQRDSLEKKRGNVQVNSIEKMPEHIKRHCGPNPQKHYTI